MTEVLSQQEIDALLSSITTDEDSYREEITVERQKHVKIYDFKRPDKFSKDQIRTLQMMHETFARITTTSLSAQLRNLVSVHVISVDQMTYEEFIRSIPNPTTLAVITMEPLKGNAILEVDPGISFAIVDRLFGGTGESPKVNRELTDIEISVMEGIIVKILSNLRESWSNVIDLRPRLANIETNSQFAQIVPPNDMVVLIILEAKVGNVEGIIDLCIPYLTIEPIISKLSAQYWYSSIRKGVTKENFDTLKDNLSKMMVDVVAQLGKVDLTIEEVSELQEGDIIKLPKNKIKDHLTMRVGNVEKFLCRPGIVGNNLAVKVLDKIGQHSEDVFKDLLEKHAYE